MPPRRRDRIGKPSKLASGLWLVKVRTEERDANDRIVYKRFKGRTASVAVDKATEFAERYERGITPGAGRGYTVESWLQYWLTSLSKARPSTKKGYGSYIQNYIVPTIGAVKLERLEIEHLTKLENHLGTARTARTNQPLALRTQRQIIAIALAGLNSAVQNRKLLWNPAQSIEKPTIPKQAADRFTFEEAMLLLDHVRGSRLEARWAMTLLTAPRQGEALGLELDRVNLKEGTVDFSWQLQRLAFEHGCADSRSPAGTWPCGNRKGGYCPDRKLDLPRVFEHRRLTGGLYLTRPKTKNAERVIPLVEPLRQLVERRILEAASEPNPHGLLFTSEPKRSKPTGVLLDLDGSPVDPSRDSAAWSTILSELGLPYVRAHNMRHTAATILSTNGIPVEVIRDILGHGSVDTSDIYRATELGSKRAALDLVGQKILHHQRANDGTNS